MSTTAEDQVTDAPSTGVDGWSDLVRHPGYPRYFLAVALARVPTTMWAVAVALLVLSRTGSLSLAGVTIAVPARCAQRSARHRSARLTQSQSA